MLTNDIELRVELRIKELLEKHNTTWPGKQMKYPLVTFDVKGVAAGYANYTKYWIGFNPILLAENEDDFIKQTVAHELAHLVTDHHTDCMAQSHGREWKRFMRFFGVEPKTTHNYGVTNARVRNKKRVLYKCDCRTHDISVAQHKKIVSGKAKYECRYCKTFIVRNL